MRRIAVCKADPGRESMILDNLGLVSFVTSRLREHSGHGAWDREDIFAFGIVGLIQAVDSYDPARGVSFASFATIRIRGSILDFKRRMDLLPRSANRNAAILEEERAALVSELGRWPTHQELAQRHGTPIKDVLRIEADAATSLVYLDQARHIQSQSGSGWEPCDSEAVNADDVLEADFLKDVVTSSIRALTRRDREIIEMRYLQSLPLHEIARRLKVTQSRVSQLNKRILTQLKSRICTELDLAS
jgi:RNA polymerase sigma factor FliA